MNAEKAIELAAKYADRSDSAMVCLNDAKALFERDMKEDAIKRACTSLAHSVGVFSASYVEARACLSEGN